MHTVCTRLTRSGRANNCLSFTNIYSTHNWVRLVPYNSGSVEAYSIVVCVCPHATWANIVHFPVSCVFCYHCNHPLSMSLCYTLPVFSWFHMNDGARFSSTRSQPEASMRHRSVIHIYIHKYKHHEVHCNMIICLARQKLVVKNSGNTITTVVGQQVLGRKYH